MPVLSPFVAKCWKRMRYIPKYPSQGFSGGEIYHLQVIVTFAAVPMYKVEGTVLTLLSPTEC